MIALNWPQWQWKMRNIKLKQRPRYIHHLQMKRYLISQSPFLLFHNMCFVLPDVLLIFSFALDWGAFGYKVFALFFFRTTLFLFWLLYLRHKPFAHREAKTVQTLSSYFLWRDNTSYYFAVKLSLDPLTERCKHYHSTSFTSEIVENSKLLLF